MTDNEASVNENPRQEGETLEAYYLRLSPHKRRFSPTIEQWTAMAAAIDAVAFHAMPWGHTPGLEMVRESLKVACPELYEGTK